MTLYYNNIWGKKDSKLIAIKDKTLTRGALIYLTLKSNIKYNTGSTFSVEPVLLSNTSKTIIQIIRKYCLLIMLLYYHYIFICQDN